MSVFLPYGVKVAPEIWTTESEPAIAAFLELQFIHAAQQPRAKQALRAQCHLCLVFPSFFLFLNGFFFSQRGEHDISQICDAGSSN